MDLNNHNHKEIIVKIMFNNLEEEAKTKSIIISSKQRKHIYI